MLSLSPASLCGKACYSYMLVNTFSRNLCTLSDLTLPSLTIPYTYPYPYLPFCQTLSPLPEEGRLCAHSLCLRACHLLQCTTHTRLQSVRPCGVTDGVREVVQDPHAQLKCCHSSAETLLSFLRNVSYGLSKHLFNLPVFSFPLFSSLLSLFILDSPLSRTSVMSLPAASC